MIIELRGVDFVNKGGELMLHAIIAKVREQFSDVLFVMEKTHSSPRKKLLKYGIYTKTNFRYLKLPFNYISTIMPVFLRRHLYYVNEAEIEIVLDASGFAFGEVWGAKKASVRLGNHISKWSKEGKKIILMPQAFGPFINQELVAVMKTIVNYADLIFVRDKISHMYLAKLGDASKFNLAPDFTNLLQGSVPQYFDNSLHEVAIIVNSKMIDTTKNQEGQAYLNLLTRMITVIGKLGYKPYFLIHELSTDRKVAETINEKLIQTLPVVQEDNPIYLKGIIAKSKAVITSRYHGLVSCLSQGIPCLATAWSHKYEMLLKDYNYLEGMLDVNADDLTLQNKIEFVLTESSRNLLIKKLKSESTKQKQRSEQMWQKVFKTINITHSSKPHFTTPALTKNGVGL